LFDLFANLNIFYIQYLFYKIVPYVR